MAALCLRRLRVHQLALTGHRTFSTVSAMAKDSQLRSYIEIERKFRPTEELKWNLQMSDALGEEGKDEVHRSAISSLAIRRLPNEVFRDTYYDLNDQLSAKGIWIRHRTHNLARFHASYPLQHDEACGTLEAKVRLGGDYVDSQFLEVRGRAGVAVVLNDHMPGTKLEDLEVLADLLTSRRACKIGELDRSVPRPDGHFSMSVVVDDVCETLPFKPLSGGFEHEIGEVEIIQEVVGGTSKREHEELRQQAAIGANLVLATFMSMNEEIFVTSPKPKGKLSAFLEWKRQKELAM